MKDEKIYVATMHLALELLRNGLIDKDEYKLIDEHFKAKYNPVISIIFTDIDLINI